jgi:hypothetical protein
MFNPDSHLISMSLFIRISIFVVALWSTANSTALHSRPLSVEIYSIKVGFVPITDCSQIYVEEFSKRHSSGKDLLDDGIHPNSAGHALIAELVKPKLDKLIASTKKTVS